MEPIDRPILDAANARSRRLRELVRAPEILVMPGAYDVLSALLFERMGFQAIQGTSGGIAAALGYPDGEVMSRDCFLDVSGRIAAALAVPFNADGERGYGDEAEIPGTVRGLVARGVAGMNLEDGARGKPGSGRGLVPLEEQLRKIAAVMEAKRRLGSEFFLNARVDAFHVVTADPKKALDEAIRRGNAYAEAGGDCIFYLNLHAPETIRIVVREVKAPVSILAGPQSPSVTELQDLGVARVSYGSGFLKAALGATKRLAEEILESGTAAGISAGVQTPEISALLAGRKGS
ncbi:MAG TPA: isocitrate lyase/phosphoenolpyruvate mutase family protein [candidate division Zixibacteria bacterium]|nr:isocitrate lyase/phosphoenolpyruvate mutase family protein [candidate division Zixibacteria bacterium]